MLTRIGIGDCLFGLSRNSLFLIWVGTPFLIYSNTRTVVSILETFRRHFHKQSLSSRLIPTHRHVGKLICFTKFLFSDFHTDRVTSGLFKLNRLLFNFLSVPLIFRYLSRLDSSYRSFLDNYIENFVPWLTWGYIFFTYKNPPNTTIWYLHL